VQEISWDRDKRGDGTDHEIEWDCYKDRGDEDGGNNKQGTPRDTHKDMGD